jgi:hypothetical protein
MGGATIAGMVSMSLVDEPGLAIDGFCGDPLP